MNNAISIEYVSAPCGAGKTHAICDYIAKNIIEKFIVVLPTIDLSTDYAKNLKDRKVPFVSCINGSNVSKKIEEAIIEFNRDNDGGVLIITQAGFRTSKYIQHSESWNLIMDEILVIDEIREFQIPYTLNTLTDYVFIDENFKNDYLYKLDHKENLLRLNADKNLADTKKLVSDMASNYEAFVEKNNWNKLVDRKEITNDCDGNNGYGNQENIISIVTMLSPSIVGKYKSVTILGANIDKSMLVEWWSNRHGISFVKNNTIFSMLRYNSHNNGQRLDLVYLMEKNFSKTQRNKIINEVIDTVQCDTYGEKLAQMAIKVLGKDYLYITNNDFDDQRLADSGGTKAKVISHGSNDYDNFHKFYFSAALNKTPSHTRILNALGFNDDFLKRATVVEVTYQGLMRTSLRNPNATEPVICVVNDQFTAITLAEYFPNCNVRSPENTIMKDIPFDQVDKNRRHHVNQTLKSNFKNISPIKFSKFLNTIARNNIVRHNEPVKKIPKEIVNLDDGYSFVVINFEGNIDDYKAVATNNKLASIVYSSIKVEGYTAAIFLKDTSSYDINLNLIPMLNSNNIRVYGDELFAPSYDDKGDCEFFKINCDRLTTLERCALNIH